MPKIFLPVNEIFCSVQGEGYWAGEFAVFIRLSGCNMNCPFCDTDHAKFEEMTIEAIVKKAEALARPAPKVTHVVVTGGEPHIHKHLENLLKALKGTGRFRIQVETNGTPPRTEHCLKYVDWLTCSPKIRPSLPVAQRANEYKVLVGKNGPIIPKRVVETLRADHLYVQPVYGEPGAARKCMEWVKEHEGWKLSGQLHKMYAMR